MSLKSQMPSVRFFAVENLKKDSNNLNNSKSQLSELENTEKNSTVLASLKSISF